MRSMLPKSLPSRMPMRQGRPSGWRPMVRYSPKSTTGALKAFIAQHVGYGVRDEALGNAVQRNGHAGAREPDGSRAAFDLAEIHHSVRDVARAGRDVRLDVGMRPEMRLVKPPQGLYRNVESAAAQLTEALAFLDQFAQLGRRLASVLPASLRREISLSGR